MADQIIPESYSFEYKGKTYTVYKDPQKTRENPIDGLWENREWKTLYHRYSRRLKRKHMVGDMPKMPKMCGVCGGTYTSDWKHEQSVKHQLVVKALELQKQNT